MLKNGFYLFPKIQNQCKKAIKMSFFNHFIASHTSAMGAQLLTLVQPLHCVISQVSLWTNTSGEIIILEKNLSLFLFCICDLIKTTHTFSDYGKIAGIQPSAHS